MVGMDQKPSLQEMIDAVIKTFIVAHADDGDAHLAQALVYNAGRLAWRLREMGVDVEHKTSISDVVTDADRAAERFVAGVLEAVRPEDGILGEEGAARESQSGRTWVIDPVDGAENDPRGIGKRQCRAPVIEAGGEVEGAVDRIDDPGAAGLRLAVGALLADDAVLSAQSFEDARDEALGGKVGVSDDIRTVCLLGYVHTLFAQAPG